MAKPAIAGLVTSVTYNENTVNAAGQLLDASVTFTDADGDFNGGTLTVSGLVSGDVISIRSQGSGAGQISYNSSTGAVSYGGVVIGMATGGVGATFTITFDADATSAAIDALIQTLTYATTSDTSAAARTLTLNVTDAAGGSFEGADTFIQLTAAANPLNGLDAGATAHAAFADIDGDGDLDLFSGNNFADLTYFENTGTATAPVFVERTGAANPMDGVTFGSYTAPTFVDIDGDDDMDLFVNDVSGGFRYFRNDGTTAAPAFTEVTGSANPLNFDVGTAGRVRFADLDGDDDLDAIISNTSAGVMYYRNVGTASAPDLNAFGGIFNPFPAFTGSRGTPVFIDVDGDGDLDAFVNTGLAQILFFENTGTASAPAYVQASSQFDGQTTGGDAAMTGADIDGDGDIDLVIGKGDGTFDYYRFGPKPGVEIIVNVTPEIDGTGAADSLSGTAEGQKLQGFGGDDFLDGAGGDDLLIGDAGADYLRGGSGNDTMRGGTGNDTYVVTEAGDVADEAGGDGIDLVISSVSYTLALGVENLTLAAPGGAINGTGTADANVINGNAFANTLTGLNGTDTLNGGGGDDVLDGGGEADILDGGTQNDTLYGGAGQDILNGGAGNDYLDGGTFDDVMTGGLGNDTYVVVNSGDQTIEAVNGGRDLVLVSLSWTLGANIEDMTLTGGGDASGTGNALANTITGNSGANDLRGLAGNDILFGGDGNDALFGGAGIDHLTGGAGADRFVVTLDDIGSTDLILDLNFAQGDRIDLTLLDADSIAGGDQEFVFAAKFTKVAGQAVLTYDAGSDVTLLRLDMDGDGKADINLKMAGDQRGGHVVHVGDPISEGGWLM